MMTHDQMMCILGEAIKEWTQAKKAFISLATYIREIEEWRKLTGVSQVRRMLEIGSGAGWFLVTAVALGFAQEGIGVDPAFSEDGTAIEEIRKTETVIHKLNLSKRVCFRICTFTAFLENAYSKTEKFDLIVFRNTLHHLYPRSKETQTDQERVSECIKDLHSTINLLSDPGYIYVMETIRPSNVYATMYNLYRSFRGAPAIDWESKRSLSEWTWILKEAGFKLIGTTRLGVPHPLFSRAPVGAKLLSSSFLIAAIGEKR